jgi:hypothetical protein
MSHVPLAVYLWLAEGRADDHRLRRALTDCAAIGEAAVGLAEACQALADQYDRDGLLGHQAVHAFSRSLGPLFDRLVTEATEEEVAALGSVMRRIEDELGEARWAQTFLVVCAGHQPRYKQLTKLFFERWLNARPGATADTRHRVLYAEARNSVDEALDLLATRIVNGRLAEVFLNSPLSMDQDVLGDAGIAELNRFFAP